MTSSTSLSTFPSCRLCGVHALTSRFSALGCILATCDRCGLVQLVAGASQDDLTVIYDADYFDHGKYVNDVAGRRERLRRLRWMEHCGVPVGAHVLEGGCAVGDFIAAAKNRYTMSGVDLAAPAIAHAKQAMPDLTERLHVAPLERPPFPQGSFDAIVLWDVLEHLWNPREVLAGLAGLLRRPGLILFSTPDIASPVARLLGRRWAFMTPPEHVSFLSPAALHRLAASFGGKVCHRMNCGKWVNLGFLIYKLGRVFPGFVPARAVKFLLRTAVSRVPLYVPTGDIMYAAIEVR